MTISSHRAANSSFHSIYWGSAEITSALQILEAKQAVFLDRLTALLNKFHGWNRSSDYYDFLCGEWLMHFSHIVYAAYLEVIRSGSPGPNGLPLRVFSDHHDFQRVNVNSLSFNQQLRSLVAEVLESGRGLVRSFEQENIAYGDSPFDDNISRKRAVLNSAVRFIGGSQAPFVFSQAYVKCSQIQWAMALVKWRSWARQDNYSYPIAATVRVDGDWRCRQSNGVSVSAFEDVFQAVLPLYIPAIYLEGFAAYREQALGLKLPRPKVAYTANSLHGHSLFKTLAAEWRESGTKILNHQHGGGYGLGLIEPCENYEIRVSDQMFTAGWYAQSEKVKPLCIPLPGRLRTHHTVGRVLLNLLTMPQYVYRIHFAGMPGTNEVMISRTEDFVRKMKGRPELTVRPFPCDYGCSMVETLRRIDPSLQIDDMRRGGLKSYPRFALVVHNYLGTSWLETLALNIPTVCFYDTDVYTFRESAQPYIDTLAAVGILHQSGDDAARFVLGVMDNPQAWWHRTEVQNARRSFVRNYANFSPDWVKEWEAEFRQWV